MIKNMKSLAKFLSVVIVLCIWVELVNFSMGLMNKPDDLLFYVGFLTLTLWIVGPILYFKENISMFLKNMKGVFFDDEKKDEK